MLCLQLYLFFLPAISASKWWSRPSETSLPDQNLMFHTLKRCFTPHIAHSAWNNLAELCAFQAHPTTRYFDLISPKHLLNGPFSRFQAVNLVTFPSGTTTHKNKTKMISEEVNSLPSKSRSLRAKSIAKRLATEKNQIESNNNTTKPRIKRSSNSSKHHTMSKYRRKVANAKERERMKLVSEAFDRLSNVVPVYKMMTANNSNVIPQDEIIPNAQVW